MRNLLLASAVVVIAIACGSAAKSPQVQNTVTPSATAQAQSAIAELPLPTQTKEAYYARIERTPESKLPYLVEEARRSVDIPMGARVQGTEDAGHSAPTMTSTPVLRW